MPEVVGVIIISHSFAHVMFQDFFEMYENGGNKHMRRKHKHEVPTIETILFDKGSRDMAFDYTGFHRSLDEPELQDKMTR